MKVIRDPVSKHNRSMNVWYEKTKYKDGGFEFPEYNFSTMIAIAEGEGYVQKGFERQEVLCTKEGWTIVGRDQKAVLYIKDRLKELELVTKISTEALIETILSDLIRFQNSFLVLVRDEEASSGAWVLNDEGKELPPIAGIFPVPIETVMVRYDERGNVNSIKQCLNSNYHRKDQEQIWDKDHFLHFHIGYKGGKGVALPILSVIYPDIEALRAEEENQQLIYQQFGSPLYHYIVGTLEAPAETYPDGTSEVDTAARNLAALPPSGIVVTSERHKIETKGAAQHALDPMPPISHYKKRVFTGLNVSSIDMGEGNEVNRSTSDNLSQTIVDRCKYIQKKFCDQWKMLVMQPLLKESLLGDSALEEGAVSLQFREIDLEGQVKKENHQSQLFSQHCITHDELRKSLGLEIMTEEDFARTYLRLIEEPKLLLQAKTSAFSAEAAALAAHPSSSVTPEQLEEEKEREKEKGEAEVKRREEEAKQRELEAKKNGGEKAATAQANPSNQHSSNSLPSSFPQWTDFLDLLALSGNIHLNSVVLDLAIESEIEGTLGLFYQSLKQWMLSGKDLSSLRCKELCSTIRRFR